MNLAGEQLLAASGLGYTILCAAMFMQNFLILMPRSSPMECSAPMGTGRCAFIGCSDVAAVAAAVLTQDSHDGNAYLATREQALSVDDAPGTCRTRLPARTDVATFLWRPCVLCSAPGRL